MVSAAGEDWASQPSSAACPQARPGTTATDLRGDLRGYPVLKRGSGCWRMARLGKTVRDWHAP